MTRHGQGSQDLFSSDCVRTPQLQHILHVDFISDQYFSPEYVSPRLDPKSRLISVKSPKCNMYQHVFLAKMWDVVPKNFLKLQKGDGCSQ